MKKIFLQILFFLLSVKIIFAQAKPQTIPKLEFNNQKITDALMVLSDLAQCTIIPDESVSGYVTYYFDDGPFEKSLKDFLSAYDLYYSKDNDVYHVSKVFISENENGLLTIDAEEVDLTFLIKTISKKISKTIMYDSLPKGNISIHAHDVDLTAALEMLIRKNWDYEVIAENNYHYIQKAVMPQTNAGRYSKVSVTQNNELFNLDAPRVSFTDLLKKLFETAGKEHLILMKSSPILENISYKNKTFEQLLKLILDSAAADYVLKDDVYYIFETQKNNVVKKLQNTEIINVKNISVQKLISLIPANFESSSLLKLDKNSNTVYLTGTAEEISQIKSLIEKIDVPVEGKSYQKFDIHFKNAIDIIQLIPQDLLRESTIIPETNSFISLVSSEEAVKINSYLKLIDKANTGIPVKLKYLKNDVLLKNLPPAISKDDLIISQEESLVFFVGPEKKFNAFLDLLKIIDIPKPQIRYDLLIIQYQKGKNENFSKSLTVQPVSDNQSSGFAVTGMLSNLVNISFDVVSKFGYQFAVNLSNEIEENRAKVLADTTLNALSGTDVKFQNTNTYRYNEGVLEDSSNIIVKTSTKEITSGLQLTINGWVSGDGMITMKVNAEVSKQGNVTSTKNNLPPTSEKIVTSEIRTKSGEPIIIGGLLQTEITNSNKKIPLLGSIPVIGKLFQDKNVIEETSEMAIYIVPHAYNKENEELSESQNIEKYYKEYLQEKS